MIPLLRYIIFGTALPQNFSRSQEEWHDIAHEAHRNKISVLLCDAVERLPPTQRPPKEVIMTLVAQKEACEANYGKAQEALTTLNALLAKESKGTDKDLPPLPLQVVKGFVLAHLYPTPQHRTFCDIDLYTGPYTEALALRMEAHGISCQRSNPRHITFRFHGVTIEAHQHLFFFPDDRSRYDSRTPLDMPPAWQALFFAAHACYDTLFFDYPVSLKTCVDWTLLLKSLDDKSLATMKKEKDGATFSHFADALTAYCHQLFPEAHLEKYFDTPDINTQDKADTIILDMADAAAIPFEKIFRQFHLREHGTLMRVGRRSWKYIIYNRYYKKMFGKNMFAAFYFKKLRVALRQKGHPAK